MDGLLFWGLVALITFGLMAVTVMRSPGMSVKNIFIAPEGTDWHDPLWGWAAYGILVIIVLAVATNLHVVRDILYVVLHSCPENVDKFGREC